MLLQYWALLNPLHGSLMRSCTGGRHTYLCLSIFFCTLFANFTDFQYFVLHWNILKLFQSCSQIYRETRNLVALAMALPELLVLSHRQNLDSIKIIDFRNGFSLWPGLIFAPLTRPTPATNTETRSDRNNKSRVPTRVLINIFAICFLFGEHFDMLKILLGKILNPL